MRFLTGTGPDCRGVVRDVDVEEFAVFGRSTTKTNRRRKVRVGTAAELVKISVDLILVPGSGQARDAKQATATIPIVFSAVGGDPVRLGLVASLAHPGGNLTGTTAVSVRILGKRLELLKEILSKLAWVAVL